MPTVIFIGCLESGLDFSQIASSFSRAALKRHIVAMQTELGISIRHHHMLPQSIVVA